MSGVDTVRGIGYQNAHAVLIALDVLRDPTLASIQVEGTDDILDIEVRNLNGNLSHGIQVKIRDDDYTWGREELLRVFRRWANLNPPAQCTFEFLTDGRLGPTGDGVRTALLKAANGNLAAIAKELGVPDTDPVCGILGRARIRQEPSGVDVTLQDAEREVRTMLAAQYRPADLDDAARAAVDRLFTLLFITAGEYDVEQRVVSRAEIADALGGIDRLAVVDRWPGTLEAEYLSAAVSLSIDAIEPHLVDVDSFQAAQQAEAPESSTGDAQALLAAVNKRLPALIVGPTGSGKSTAAKVLVRQAAAAEKTVILAHAETYSSTLLSGLAADALATMLRRDISSAAGQQIVNDPNVILIIDGVSEVPRHTRDSLRDELAIPTSAGRGASVVLVGRDVAKLKSTLPSSAAPSTFRVSGLSWANRRKMAEKVLDRAPQSKEAPQQDAHRLASQAEQVLDDAAGNPMLFTMALELLRDGAAFTDRAAMYAATVERLARRGGATDMDLSTTVLGSVFADLLDRGKRFANPYEWTRKLNEVAADLTDRGFSISVRAVQDASERSGLIVPIGFSQTHAPVHDSYADYLAGLAHARGQAPIPSEPSSDDEQRLLFTAEIAGVTDELARTTAEHLPFLAVRMSDHDHRACGEDAPAVTTQLFRYLAPLAEVRNISLYRAGGRVVATLSDTDPGWLATAPVPGGPAPVIVFEPNDGPLVVAVRMWRSVLRATRSQQRWLEPSRFTDAESAAAALLEHSIASANSLKEMIKHVAPAAGADALDSTIGPAGLEALVHDSNEHDQGRGWPVEYRNANVSSARIIQAGNRDYPRHGSSSVEYLLRISPDATAYMRLSAAINTLTSPHWL